MPASTVLSTTSGGSSTLAGGVAGSDASVGCELAGPRCTVRCTVRCHGRLSVETACLRRLRRDSVMTRRVGDDGRSPCEAGVTPAVDGMPWLRMRSAAGVRANPTAAVVVIVAITNALVAEELLLVWW